MQISHNKLNIKLRILCMYYLKIYLHMKVNIFNKLNLLDFKYTILFDITCMFIHLYVKR